MKNWFYMRQDLRKAFDTIRTAPIDESRLLRELSDICSCNTHSYNKNGLARFSKLWSSLIEELPKESEKQHASSTVLEICGRTAAKKQMLLSGHYDTVFSEASHFQNCTINNQTIFGPGVADMKGGLIIMKEALKLFESLEFEGKENLGWTMLLTGDEEIGSSGSRDIIQRVSERLKLKKAVGIVFEPTIFDPKNNEDAHIIQRPGSTTIRISTEGIAAHAGRDFWQGRNAVAALAELIFSIEKLFLKKSPGSNTTLNIASIHGGSAPNIVPEKAQAVINIRSDSQQEIDRLISDISSLIKELDRPGILHRLFIDASRPPKERTDEVKSLVSLYEKAHVMIHPAKKLHWTRSGGVSDGNLFQSYGIPCLDGMGVTGGELHTEQEWCLIPSITERIRDITAFFVLVSEEGGSLL